MRGNQPASLDLPRDVDDLHPVPERVRDGVQHVGRAEEEHLGQVHRDVQVMVQEVAVLLRVWER